MRTKPFMCRHRSPDELLLLQQLREYRDSLAEGMNMVAQFLDDNEPELACGLMDQLTDIQASTAFNLRKRTGMVSHDE